MKRKVLTSRVATAALAVFCVGMADAQENGYINGVYSLFSFNPSTGAILNSYSGAGTSEPFAVATDDVTLYLPYYGAPAEALLTVSGQTGKTEGYVGVGPLVYNGVALTKDGLTAYVTTREGVSVIDTATFTVTGSIPQVGPAFDVALSPDDSTLYISINCPDACPPPGACPLKIGVCALNAATLAFEWQVKNVTGLLSVSNDGTSLYLAGSIITGKPAYPLNAINTTTQAVTNLDVYFERAFPPIRIITDPASHYAVVILQSLSTGTQTAASAYLLNTSNNKFVETLFTAAPGGMALASPASGVAFAPDGKSVWMLLSCGMNRVPNCADESGQIYLAGFSLPSGALISDQPVPGEFWGENDGNVDSVAFPR